MTLVTTRQAEVAAPPLQPALAAGTTLAAEVLASGETGGLTRHWLAAADWDGAIGPWERLAAQAGPNPFLMPAFALAARGLAGPPGLGAFVLRRDGEWLGFVPGALRFGRVFTLWTHDYAPYALPLAASGAETLVAGGLAGMLAERGVVAIDWPFGDDSPAAAALLAAWSARGQRVDAVAGHERACLTQAQPLSKAHRRQWRRLGDQGELACLSTAAGHDPEAALAAFLRLEAAGWKGARGTAFASLAGGAAFVREAIGGLIRQGHARVDLISLSGRPVAAGVALTAGERAWYWKTAYDEAFARASPGVLMAHRLGQALLAERPGLLVDSCAIPGHAMIERLWRERLAITHRFIAVAPGPGGPSYRAALALRRAAVHGRAAAKRLLRR